MKVIIYGSKGWIGSQFKELMDNNNIEYYCGKSRVDNEVSLREEIESEKPTHIVSFIGRTHGIKLMKKFLQPLIIWKRKVNYLKI